MQAHETLPRPPPGGDVVQPARHGVSDPDVSLLESLTPEERAWIIADEERWRRAYAIAGEHRGIDAGGIYRVLRNLEKSPTERLRAGLEHGRLFGSPPR